MPSNGNTGLRRGLSRSQSTANRTRSFIKYAKLGDDKNLLSMLRSKAQPDWEFEGESALNAAASKAQVKCVNELIKAGAVSNQRDSKGEIYNYSFMETQFLKRSLEGAKVLKSCLLQ